MSNNDYERREFWEVTHYNVILHGGNGKPVSIALYEPDKSEIRFFKKTGKPLVTEFELPLNKK